MMYCQFCGAAMEADVKFCPSCGRTQAPDQPAPGEGTTPPQSPPQNTPEVVPPYGGNQGSAIAADPGARAGAYLIDLIPAVIVMIAIGWIPIVGAMLAGFILMLYWLLRDITGASLGKLALGLRVGKKDGSPPDTKEKILRNIPIAVGPALLIVPLAGYVIAPPIAAILIITEAVLLLTQKQRLGDMMAGSGVFKK